MAQLNITRGTTYVLGYQHQIDGVDAPLTDCTLYFTVKTEEYDSTLADTTAVILKTLTNPDFTDAAAGYTVITLDDTDTAYSDGTTDFLNPTLDYYYDIRVKESDGSTYLRDSGKVKLSGTPTNRNI